MEHSIVEQQLDIMRLLLYGAVLPGTPTLYVVVLPRLLLDKQTHILCHEVDTSLQTEGGTDERWLKQVFMVMGRLSDGFIIIIGRRDRRGIAVVWAGKGGIESLA